MTDDFSFDDFAFDDKGGSGRGTSFSGENIMSNGGVVEMVMAGSSTGHGASSTSLGGAIRLVWDIEDGLNDTIAHSGQEVRRSMVGLTHMVNQVENGVNDRLARDAGLEPPQHHADNRLSGLGAPPRDGLDDTSSPRALQSGQTRQLRARPTIPRSKRATRNPTSMLKTTLVTVARRSGLRMSVMACTLQSRRQTLCARAITNLTLMMRKFRSPR